jgi:hypothetical protein
MQLACFINTKNCCLMINTGEIAKKDLLKLWSQKEFDQHMPNNDLKEFIIQVLVHLDILVEHGARIVHL